MIKIKNLSKYYGEKENRTQILKNLSFEIEQGEFVVILGPSGSGKSTLLNVISGLEKPEEGLVQYDLLDITTLNDHALTLFRKEKIGFIFQQYFLLNNLTVSGNVKMGSDLTGNREYRKMIEAVGLIDKADKYPTQLSGGEQQRVSIARALAKKPEVLFMDEPTGALDEKTGRQILDCIMTMQKELNFTIIMVTHNQNIADMADKVIRMNSGQIVEIKTNEIQKGAYEIGW